MTVMPGKAREGRSTRSFRVDDDDWAEFGQVAYDRDVDRGWVLRQFIRWYLGRGELPERPSDR